MALDKTKLVNTGVRATIAEIYADGGVKGFY